MTCMDLVFGRSSPRLSFHEVDPRTLRNARRKDQASFFEDEGLKEFLHLEWGIKKEETLVREFIFNYNLKERTVSMDTGKISIDDKLLQEVFHLPMGDYKMRKEDMPRRVESPFFRPIAHSETGLDLNGCNDEVWSGRFEFLHDVVSGMSMRCDVPYIMVEFLQAEGKKRDWLDAFRWFFEAEIRRIPIKTAKTSCEDCTRIRTHISLILAHMEDKRKAAPGAAQTDDEGLKNALNEKSKHSEEKSEESEEEPEEGDDVCEDAEEEEFLLEQFDEGRRAITKLVARVDNLRKEVQIWKDEYLNRHFTSGVEIRALQKEVEKWKRECATAERAREVLEAKVTTFWSSTKLETIATTGEDATPVPKEAQYPNLIVHAARKGRQLPLAKTPLLSPRMVQYRNLILHAARRRQVRFAANFATYQMTSCRRFKL